jgi:dTDP-4-amino-4,6-dideoxygalactose transaminase
MNNISRLKVPKFPSQLKYVQNAYESGELVQGNDLKKFESYLLKTFNFSFCHLTNSGNSALLLSILGLGLKNKKILIPSISTCFALENAVLASGNIPVYGDVCLKSTNLNNASILNSEVEFDAIISPNMFGISSDINLLSGFGKPIIEDASQSFITNMQIKSNADFLVFSFYPTKLINAIDGGAVLNNSSQIAERMSKRVYYDYQLVKDDVPSFNLRMPNLHAAFGLGTIENLGEIKSLYEEQVRRFDFILKDFNFVTRLGWQKCLTTLKYVLKFETPSLLNDFRMQMNTQSIPTSKELIRLTVLESEFTNALELENTTCSIPLYFDLQPAEVEFIVAGMSKVLTAIKNGNGR